MQLLNEILFIDANCISMRTLFAAIESRTFDYNMCPYVQLFMASPIEIRCYIYIYFFWCRSTIFLDSNVDCPFSPIPKTWPSIKDLNNSRAINELYYEWS